MYRIYIHVYLILGTDEYGEPCHAGMYKHLWINFPKECAEYPDYTFDKHFGKAIPSYAPRAVHRHYLEGIFLKLVSVLETSVHAKNDIVFCVTILNS